LEFRYTKPIAGLVVEVLDPAAAASAERRLAEILVACVDAGASVSFLPPMAREKAQRFWRKTASEVASGKVLLLAAWMDGTIAGTVQLDLAMSENQPHRAELEKLLVHPEFRRRGIARALLRRAEQAAIGHGRTLLTLDTRAGDLAEALYRAMGWTEAGRIPGYALNADRTPSDTVFFWRRLAP
jgi:ribosomal protein S18 acetylase RimI-like enzyme